ncbi:MAG: hypothetical protein AAGD43_22645 [Pseudomonadota bacterium]
MGKEIAEAMERLEVSLQALADTNEKLSEASSNAMDKTVEFLEDLESKFTELRSADRSEV